MAQKLGADHVRAGLVRDLQKIFDELNCHIVHHQREQRFVRAPLRLEKCGNDAPDHAGDDRRRRHDDDEQPIGDLAAEHQHAHRRRQTADEHLSFCTRVPKAHSESGRHRKGDAQKNGDVVNGDERSARAECALCHGGKNGQRVVTGQHLSDNGAHHKRQQNRDRPHQNAGFQRHVIALADIKKRFMRVFFRLLHALPLPPFWS